MKKNASIGKKKEPKKKIPGLEMRLTHLESCVAVVGC